MSLFKFPPLFFFSEAESSDPRSTHPPDPSPPSGQLSPQSLGSTNADSGTEYLSDSTTDSLDVTMSLCGRGDISQISKGKERDRHARHFCWLLSFCFCCIVLCSSTHSEILLVHTPALNNRILNIKCILFGCDFVVSCSILFSAKTKKAALS